MSRVRSHQKHSSPHSESVSLSGICVPNLFVTVTTNLPNLRLSLSNHDSNAALAALPQRIDPARSEVLEQILRPGKYLGLKAILTTLFNILGDVIRVERLARFAVNRS